MISILTITVAAESFDLTDRETVKDELGLTGTTEDDKIDRWIVQASAAIASYCNRVFGAETLSEQFRLCRCEASLILRRRPVSSITTVTEDGTALETDEFEIDADSGLLYRLDGDDNRSHWPAVKITVVYLAGYNLPDDAPALLARACIALVKHYRLNATRDTTVKGESIPGVRDVQYWIGTTPGSEGDLPPDVVGMISAFRDPVVA